uniref:NADH-ubiquinone oxidoreductase chain 3 n=1 Tax=Synura synuroidea TaxID=47573 RepID=Q9MG92_9STRA|nr:NADH dehydrogenase subunit 3 [Synura synuroidea]AAF36957.1 NADH dehydrogenase subunit 3 [Synura synuroidea]
MQLFYQEITSIGVLILFSFFLCFILLFFSFRFSPYNPDTEKISAYECGFDPYEDARNVFDVRFYLIAILFIIFDLEAVYFYPWCVSFSFLNINSFWIMFDFIFELGIGYFYIWEVGALDWE